MNFSHRNYTKDYHISPFQVRQGLGWIRKNEIRTGPAVKITVVPPGAHPVQVYVTNLVLHGGGVAGW